MSIPIESAALNGFSKTSFTSSSHRTHDVYRIGSGPAVLVIHEVPGITPLVAAFGRKVAEHGMSAVLPDLFGTPGREPVGSYVVSSMVRACVSREFTVFATNKTSPAVRYLRELASFEHERCGGPGVGAIGMCLTGADDGLCLMGLRFSNDKKSPGERFARLHQELGENFIAVEIDSSSGNPWGYKTSAHSVLTQDYVDEIGSPTRKALDDVLEFFASRLGVTSTPQ